MSSLNYLIGIAGRKRVGKDETAKAIEKCVTGKFNVIHFSFGEEIVKEAADLLGQPIEEILKNKKFYRPLLQWWKEYRVRLVPNYWNQKLLEEVESEIKSTPSKNHLFIVTGIRIPEELMFLNDIKINSMVCFVKRNTGLREDPHASENSITEDSCDWTLENNGTLESLELQVSKMLKQFGVV